MMKILVLVFLLFGGAYADSFKIAGTLLDMDYVESDRNGGFLDSEKSDFNDIVGLELEYLMVIGSGYGGSNESALSFSVDYVKGESAYKGSLQSTTSSVLIPFESTTDMTIIEPKLRWSETKRGEAYDVGVFTSIGYRYWKRDLGSQYGYKEEYSWAYGEVGLKALFHDGDWHIGFEAAYQKAYAPKLHAATAGGLDFDLGDTDGYYYEIPLSYDIDETYSIELSYKAQYWNIEASNVVNGYYEPHSETNNQKISVGLVIRW